MSGWTVGTYITLMVTGWPACRIYMQSLWLMKGFFMTSWPPSNTLHIFLKLGICHQASHGLCLHPTWLGTHLIWHCLYRWGHRNDGCDPTWPNQPRGLNVRWLKVYLAIYLLHPYSLMWLAENHPSHFYLVIISGSTLNICFTLHLVILGSDQKERVKWMGLSSLCSVPYLDYFTHTSHATYTIHINMLLYLFCPCRGSQWDWWRKNSVFIHTLTTTAQYHLVWLVLWRVWLLEVLNIHTSYINIMHVAYCNSLLHLPFLHKPKVVIHGFNIGFPHYQLSAVSICLAKSVKGGSKQFDAIHAGTGDIFTINHWVLWKFPSWLVVD